MSPRAFFHTDAGALRAPWRVTVFIVEVVAAWFVIESVAGAFAAPAVQGGALPAQSLSAIALESWIDLAAVALATAMSVRLVDRVPWSYVGLGPRAASPRRLVEGLALGALAIGLPAALLLGVGWLRAVPWPDVRWARALFWLALILLPAAFTEELLFRGYVFAVLRESAGLRVALVVTSVLFGVVHLQNPQVSPEAIVMVILAGVFLAGVLVATGSLWAAWMAHFAWNWMLSAVLHAAVSGIPFPTPGWRVVDAGPDWATGGGWGPEGGVAAGLGMTAGLWYLFARRRRRGES